MNAAAAQRLEDILRGANPVRVATVRIDHYPMTSALVKQRFEAAKNVEVNDHGMGAEQPNGDWLWITDAREHVSTGGHRA